MSRDGNGVYSLPAGNPVAAGDPIESTWANTTLDDIKDALTNSLDRRGLGGMLVPFEFSDGLVGAPGFTWSSETTSGIYRSGPGDMRVSILGADRMRWTQTGVEIRDSSSWREVITISAATNGQRLEYNGTDWVPYTPPANGKVGGGMPTGGTNGNQLSWNSATSTWDTIAPTTGTAISPGTSVGQVARWDGTGYVPAPNLEINASGNIIAPGIVSPLLGGVTGNLSGDLITATTNTNNLNVSGNIAVSGNVDGVDIATLSGETNNHINNDDIHFDDVTIDGIAKLRKDQTWVQGIEATATAPELPITEVKVVQTLPLSPDARTLYIVTT